MAYNSTIINKKKNLSCGHYDYNFSRGRCKQCATIQDTQKRISEQTITEDDLSDLIHEADAIVSKYVRKIAADKDGNVQCYTCPTNLPIAQMQAGHYISRYCMLLRFDYSRNIRCQCENCNIHKKGNLAIFGQRLEQELNGITEILYTESHVIYKYTRDELRSLINELNLKIKQLK